MGSITGQEVTVLQMAPYFLSIFFLYFPST